MITFEHIEAAILEARQTSARLVRIEMNAENLDRLEKSVEPQLRMSFTEATTPTYKGTPIHVSNTLQPGEYALVFR